MSRPPARAKASSCAFNPAEGGSSSAYRTPRRPSSFMPSVLARSRTRYRRLRRDARLSTSCPRNSFFPAKVETTPRDLHGSQVVHSRRFSKKVSAATMALQVFTAAALPAGNPVASPSSRRIIQRAPAVAESAIAMRYAASPGAGSSLEDSKPSQTGRRGARTAASLATQVLESIQGAPVGPASTSLRRPVAESFNGDLVDRDFDLVGEPETELVEGLGLLEFGQALV